MNAQSNIEIPETEEEFDKLDFGTSCAVAGLQLGRTKVFLRREAFDRIESLRVAILGKSAAVIQAQMRGRVQRLCYLRLREATVRSQAVIRYFLTNLEVIRAKNKVRKERWASTTIQLAYRRYKFRTLGADRQQRMTDAATTLQAFTRGSLARIHLEDIWPSDGVKPGLRDKEALAETSAAQDPIVVVHRGPSMEEIAELKCVTNKVFNHLREEKWDDAVALMEEHPQVAQQSEEGTGMLPMHILAQHNLHTAFEKAYKLFPAA